MSSQYLRTEESNYDSFGDGAECPGFNRVGIIECGGSVVADVEVSSSFFGAGVVDATGVDGAGVVLVEEGKYDQTRDSQPWSS